MVLENASLTQGLMVTEMGVGEEGMKTEEAMSQRMRIDITISTNTQ